MIKKKRVYLDFVASAPVSDNAKRAFLRALSAFGNPSSAHADGATARFILEDARNIIARIVEAKTDDVLFTSGATEANAIAIRGHVQALMQSNRDAHDIHVLYSPTSHSSIVKTAESLRSLGVCVEKIPLTKNGIVDTGALASMLREQTALVSMDAVCGETGIIGNSREVRRVLEKANMKKRALLHVDASQAPCTERLTRSHWGADMLVLDAQKVGGVRGVGAIIAHRTIPFTPLFEGGGQERGVRSGTPPVALAVAFATALKEVTNGREKFRARAEGARTKLLKVLNTIQNCVVNEGKNNAPNILNFSLIGRDTDYLLALLDEAGFSVSTKSACESDTQGSRVIKELTGDDSRSWSTLRVSWGPSESVRDILRFSKVLLREVTFLDENRI
ncbi:Cysteine desulfurase [hydrothermal vent metagenome]|uniref:Cysteine desulfurase n=1 Tax=hydrothermal vent metagenome TaxID=652676 RepID=A0A3B0VM32_9ZZZZ